MENILVIATFNRHKSEEIRAILPGLRLELRSLADFPGAGAPEETGATLAENALIKAAAAAKFCGHWALADDTGLEVDALGGAPGIRSARYAGESASFGENNVKLLSALAGRTERERTARFVCVAALVSPDGRSEVCRGTLEGAIIGAPRGSNGFGYDPVFEVAGTGRTLAEFSAAEKNAISHRVRALRGLIPSLERLGARG